MGSEALFQPILLSNTSQDDAVCGALTSPLPESVSQKDTTCLRVIRENYGTAQILMGGRILDGSFLFWTHLPSIKVQACERGRELAIKLS